MASSSAHLLLQADPGCAEDLAVYVGALSAVTESAVTSGPYDVIALVDASADRSRVLADAKRAPGLARLGVCRPA